MTDTNTRLDLLEQRIAHQDHAIEELNETITAQWKLIEDMKRQLARVSDQMRDVEGAVESITGREPPPPHY